MKLDTLLATISIWVPLPELYSTSRCLSANSPVLLIECPESEPISPAITCSSPSQMPTYRGTFYHIPVLQPVSPLKSPAVPLKFGVWWDDLPPIMLFWWASLCQSHGRLFLLVCVPRVTIAALHQLVSSFLLFVPHVPTFDASVSPSVWFLTPSYFCSVYPAPDLTPTVCRSSHSARTTKVADSHRIPPGLPSGSISF